MAKNLLGATVNGSGTKIASAAPLGTSKLDTSKADLDASTVVTVGSQRLTVKAAINMGLLQRDASGTLVELNPAQAATRQG